MDMPLRTVRTNIVQSIRAFRVSDLQEAAQGLGHHFLYANLGSAQTKQDVLDLIGAQPGFVAVLEHIPANAKFDKEAREQLLDIFRDTADYWGERKIPFRCFYSFL
jgi:Barstar (barnase inhibitor)